MALFPLFNLLAMLGTGMICGLHLTLDNSVLPNLLRLDDENHFRVFYKMIKAVHTPFYNILLFGAHLFQLLACLLSFLSGNATQMYILIGVAVLYGLGVIAVSMKYIVPLQTELETLVERKGEDPINPDFRSGILHQWKRYNRIRIISALVSAVLLMVVAIWI